MFSPHSCPQAWGLPESLIDSTTAARKPSSTRASLLQFFVNLGDKKKDAGSEVGAATGGATDVAPGGEVGDMQTQLQVASPPCLLWHIPRLGRHQQLFVLFGFVLVAMSWRMGREILTRPTTHVVTGELGVIRQVVQVQRRDHQLQADAQDEEWAPGCLLQGADEEGRDDCFGTCSPISGPHDATT